MTIYTDISIKEYEQLLFRLTYKKPVMRLLLVVALLMIVWIAGYYSHFLRLPEPKFYQYTTLGLILVAQPLVIHHTIRKNYKSSNHLQEKLKIEFSNADIKITGDSFYTELTWKKLYKVVELNEWFLLYQNSLSAIMIPKRCFDNQDAAFRELLLTIPGLRTNLKPGHEL